VSASINLKSIENQSIGSPTENTQAQNLENSNKYSNSITTKDRSLPKTPRKLPILKSKKRFADRFSMSIRDTNSHKDFINRNKIVIHNVIKKRNFKLNKYR